MRMAAHVHISCGSHPASHTGMNNHMLVVTCVVIFYQISNGFAFGLSLACANCTINLTLYTSEFACVF
jgi:hypothetical protein